jgi:hypothetical protein
VLHVIRDWNLAFDDLNDLIGALARLARLGSGFLHLGVLLRVELAEEAVFLKLAD